MVQDNRPHADENAVAYFTPVDDRTMSNSNFIADFKRGFLVSAVQNSAILDIRAITDANIMYIAPDDHMIPYTARLADHDIADDDSGFGDESIGSDLGSFPQKRSNESHIQK